MYQVKIKTTPDALCWMLDQARELATTDDSRQSELTRRILEARNRDGRPVTSLMFVDEQTGEELLMWVAEENGMRDARTGEVFSAWADRERAIRYGVLSMFPAHVVHCATTVDTVENDWRQSK